VIYNQGAARRSLLGEESQNPSIAAKSMLGGRRVSYGKKRLGVRGTRRRSHKGNPAPALIGAALPGVTATVGKILKLPPARLKSPAALQAQRIAMIDTAAQAIRGGIPTIDVVNPGGKHEVGNPREMLTRWSTTMATPAGRAYAVQVLATLAATPGAAPVPTGMTATQLGQLAVPIVRELAKPRRQRRQRYPTYVDRQGRQRYSTKPPGTDLRIPAGATPTPGTPYSFFRGAVGRGGALATAGQLAVAGAAGVGAYLVTQRLLQHLGGRAQRAEEAGVNAALAVRQARADFKAQQGRDPTAAEVREMGDAYQRQLVEMGYDPVTFTRQRSGLETFLETYNPFGG